MISLEIYLLWCEHFLEISLLPHKIASQLKDSTGAHFLPLKQ